MVTHSYYENDNRVQRYARALARRGDHVVVLALKRSSSLPLVEDLEGVILHRIQDRFDKKMVSQSQHLWSLVRFMGRVCESLKQWELVGPPHTRPWDLIHVHNVPDFLVHSCRGVRALGAKVILDIHDLMPEFYADKFQKPMGSWSVRLLSRLERAAARQADHIIVANDLWVDRYARRCAAQDRCSVMINHVDQAMFPPRRFRVADTTHPLILFPGGFERHQGLDVALQAFALLKREYPGARFHLYGDGSMKGSWQSLARDLQINDSVHWFAPLPLRDMAKVMAGADLGVVPKRADGFGNEAFSTKILEFMSVGVPVVASKTRVDSHYFADDSIEFFRPSDPQDLARSMQRVLKQPARYERLVHRGKACADLLGWHVHEQHYLDLVGRLTGGPSLKRAKTQLVPPRASFNDLETGS